MPQDRILRVRELGAFGVNLVETPLLLAENELSAAQNAELYREEGELAIRKRLGISAFTTAMASPVHALVAAPLIDPPILPPVTTGLYWIGLGLNGALAHVPGSGVSDTTPPITTSGVALQNTYGGWQYYRGPDTFSIRRWNGTDDEEFIAASALSGTFFGHTMVGENYPKESFVVDADGVHVLMVGSDYAGLVLTQLAGIVRFPLDGSAPVEVGTLFSTTINLSGSTGTIYPKGPLCIWGGKYFTGSGTTSGFSASATTESAGVYSMPLGGGAWTREFRRFTDGSGAYRFWATDVTAILEPRGDALWYGADCSGNGRCMPALRKYNGTSWTEVDIPQKFAWTYFPFYADGSEVWTARVYYDTGEHWIVVRRSTDSGGTWDEVIAAINTDSGHYGSITRGFVYDGALRFVLPIETSRKAYSWVDPTLTVRYSHENESGAFDYLGSVVMP